MPQQPSYQLFYLRGSPWSLKLIWTLHSLNPSFGNSENSTITYFEHTPFVTNGYIRLKIRDFSGTLSVPILLQTAPNRVVVKDSFEIVRYFSDNQVGVVDEGNEFLKSFKENYEKMKEWNVKADKLLAFGRRLFATYKEDDFVKHMAPTFIGKYFPFVTMYLSNQMRNNIGNKYKDNDSKVTQDEAEVILQEAEMILKDSDYLVKNKFSYADISLATALENSSPTNWSQPVSFTGLNPKLAKYRKEKFQWHKKFPNLVRYQERIISSRLPGSAQQLCRL